MNSTIPDPIRHEQAHSRMQRYQKLTEAAPAEERLDSIVHFLSEEFDVPMAFISLFDKYWMWLKTQTGISKRSVLCEFFLATQDTSGSNVTVIHDLKSANFFSSHPLVTGIPYLRFFAGAPLRMSSGHTAGMLCINDIHVRQFDEIDQAVFCALRDQVVDELEKLMGSRIVSTPGVRRNFLRI